MNRFGACLRLTALFVALFVGVAFSDIPKLYFTEVHHCPAEPEPEWVEVYNASDSPQPLEEFRFCNRAKNWLAGKNKHDSIAPFETVLLTRDTLLLREYLGFKDVRLIQYAMGYLNNTAGSLAICKGDSIIDSVAWDKSIVTCPSGFNPRTGRAIRRDQVSVMVNLDIIGSTLEPVNKGREEYLIMLSNDESLKRALSEANYSSRLGLDLSFDYYRSKDFTDLFLNRIGDQKVFVEGGIPSVLFTSGITMNTNKVEDTPATLDLAVLRKRVLLVFEWMVRVLR